MLVKWILTLEAKGHSPSHGTIRELAGQISSLNGGPNTVGKRWISRFLMRHPDVSNSRNARIMFRKIAKGFEQIHFE